MAVTITIDNAGRIVLPKPLRDQFRLHKGAKIRVEPVGDHLELTPVDMDSSEPLLEKNGLLVVAATGKSCDAAEAVLADRDAREQSITGS